MSDTEQKPASLDWTWKWIPDAVIDRFPTLAKRRQEAAYRHGEAAAACADHDAPVAIAHLLQAVELEPSNIHYVYELGRIYFQQGDLEKAREYFQRALGIDFFNTDALKGLAYTLHLTGALDDAVYCYLKYLQEHPEDSDVHANLIEALILLGKYDDALSASERAADSNPQDARFPFFAARASFECGDMDKALAHIRRAEELESAHADIQCFMGVVLAARGELEPAVQKYQRAIEIEPQNAEAYLDMGRLYEDMNRQADCLAATQKARELFTAQGDEQGLSQAYWQEGWTLYQLGAWQDSIAASENALRIDGTLASVHFNLGLALLRVGDIARAKAAYQQGIELHNAGALKTDGIDDLADALQEDPNLPGGKEILDELQKEYTDTLQSRVAESGAAAA